MVGAHGHRIGCTTPPARAASRPERRRPQVLDTALQIAADDGVAAVTIAAVADRMKVTRPVVYACFADRVELIEALLRREEDLMLAGVMAALPRRRVEADEAVFVEGFRALLHTATARPDAWRLLYGNPDPAVASSFGRGRSSRWSAAPGGCGPHSRRGGPKTRSANSRHWWNCGSPRARVRCEHC